MAATGILSAANVVFYHPLDDFTEHTQAQVWTGSAGFTGGKVGTSVSAITGDSFSAGPVATNTGASAQAIASLSSSKVAVSYHRGGSYRLRIGTVSGTDITLGPETTYSTIPGGTGRADLVAMNSTTLLMSFRGSGPDQGHLRVITVSGTDATTGPLALFAPGIPRGTRLSKLDATHAALVYSEFNGGAEDGRAVIVTVSGTTATVGPAHQFSTGLVFQSNAVAALSATKFMVCWALSASGIGKAAIGTVSGTDITYGTVKDLPVLTSGVNIDAAALDSSTVFLAYNRDSFNLAGRVAKVSGTDITLGAEATLHASALGAMGALSSTEVAYSWRSPLVLGNQSLMTKATVSGTDITFGANTVYHAVANGGGRAVAGMSATSIVAAHQVGGDGHLAVGTLGQEATMTASTPGAYPATTGDDRVVVAMWTNKLGAGSSTVTIQRDYTVAFTATTIAIGPATATWSDAAIGTLMSTMAAGEHFLVADFEHTGSGNWNLKTSLDGAAFVDQGAQDSGSRGTAPASLDPGISIAAGASGQWIDELVMWAGDKTAFEPFTTQELANLNDLADVFGETMNQFEENFGAPLCWQATARMPDGSVWRDSGNGACPPVVRVPRGAEDIVVTDGGHRVSPRIVEG